MKRLAGKEIKWIKGLLKNHLIRFISSMNMLSKNQYLKALIEQRGYLIKSKKEKTKLLDEFCKTTGQNRNYVIRKIRNGSYLKVGQKERKRKVKYGGSIKTALIVCWRLFDYPCGQRLEPLLKTEVDRLRTLGELKCSDKTAQKLKEITSSTIDLKLRHQKEVERLNHRYRHKDNPLLYQIIPVKVSDEWDRSQLGNTQIDLVEHCGQSVRGEYLCTLSATDIATGWWEGEAVLGRGQLNTAAGLDRVNNRFPFDWSAIHSDNGPEFINYHLYQYTQEQGISFTRSRPYKKNDNCFVEQKNKTHVKRYVGWLRYDTKKEQRILNDLYRNELHLYKNFFQPVIKLKEKIRIGSKIHRRYEKAKTPYQRVMKSKETPEKTKQHLAKLYQSLNPAQLKRTIDAKLKLLTDAYESKNHSLKVNQDKKQQPNSLTFLIRQPKAVSLT